MKIALAQFEVQRGDLAANLGTIRSFFEQAKAAGAEALFLPEMCTTGFDWKHNLELLSDAPAQRDEVGALAREYDIAVCG